jgi:hypothetical protein
MSTQGATGGPCRSRSKSYQTTVDYIDGNLDKREVATKLLTI